MLFFFLSEFCKKKFSLKGLVRGANREIQFLFSNVAKPVARRASIHWSMACYYIQSLTLLLIGNTEEEGHFLFVCFFTHIIIVL